MATTKSKSTTDIAIDSNKELLLANADAILNTILETSMGYKEIRQLKKKTMKDGEVVYECLDEDGSQCWVYVQPPNPTMLRYAYDRIAGRAAQEATTSSLMSINVIHMIPGHLDSIVNEETAVAAKELDNYGAPLVEDDSILDLTSMDELGL